MTESEQELRAEIERLQANPKGEITRDEVLTVLADREQRVNGQRAQGTAQWLLSAITSHVASSQPRDGYVVLEVPCEVYEKAVQAGDGR